MPYLQIKLIKLLLMHNIKGRKVEKKLSFIESLRRQENRIVLGSIYFFLTENPEGLVCTLQRCLNKVDKCIASKVWRENILR